MKLHKHSKSAYSRARKRAWDMFSIFIRLRDCLKTTKTLDKGRCITCGKIYPFKELQAGHYIAGRGNSILFDEKITNAQCRGCNIFKHGDVLTYRRRLIEMYGEQETDALEIKAKIPTTLKTFQLNAIYEYYRTKVEELKGDL